LIEKSSFPKNDNFVLSNAQALLQHGKTSIVTSVRETPYKIFF